MITLRTTAAGRAAINAALAGAGAAPVLDKMVIGSGPPPSPATVTAADISAQQLQPAVQLLIYKHNSDVISGDAGFDAPAGADIVTWIALLYADGTPAAVGSIDGGLPRIPGLRLELPWAWASTDAGNLALTINIVDINALRQQLYNDVRADLDANNLGIADTRIKPVERAMQHVLRDGNPLMHCELFVDPYNLRGGPALAISGVIAGDDSIDLAEHTETLLSGDYLIFGGGNTETVRLLANLELGRRRLQSDILHTYPTATLSRTNWTITTGEAIAAAGQVYYSKPLPLADNSRTQRVIVRALSAAAAPVVAMRADAGGGYIDGVLVNTRPAADGSAGYSDYLYDVRCTDAVGHLRITTPAATRLRAVVVASVERAPSIYDIAADPELERLRYERGGFLGIFGSGEFVSLTTPGPGVFIVPPGVHKLRVRLFGGGTNGVAGQGGGHGGGFAIGVIDVSPGQSYRYVVSGIGASDDITVNGNAPIQSLFSDDSGPLLFARAGWGAGNIGEPGFGGGRCAMKTAKGGRGWGAASSAGGGAAGSQLGDGGNSYSIAGAAAGGMHAMLDAYVGASPYSHSADFLPGRDFFGGTSIIGSLTGRSALGALVPRFPGEWLPGAGGHPEVSDSRYSRYYTGHSGHGGPGAGGGTRSLDFTVGGGNGGDFGGGCGAGNNPGVGGIAAGGAASGAAFSTGGYGLIVIEW